MLLQINEVIVNLPNDAEAKFNFVQKKIGTLLTPHRSLFQGHLSALVQQHVGLEDPWAPHWITVNPWASTYPLRTLFSSPKNEDALDLTLLFYEISQNGSGMPESCPSSPGNFPALASCSGSSVSYSY